MSARDRQRILWEYQPINARQEVLAKYPLIEPEAKVRITRKSASLKREKGRRRLNVREITVLLDNLTSSSREAREEAERKLSAEGYVITERGTQ